MPLRESAMDSLTAARLDAGMTKDTTLTTLTLTAAVGSGAVGGVFLAFSTFVMPGLQRLTAAEGVAAMSSINVTAQRAPFMVAFLGTSALCAYLGYRAIRDWGTQHATLLAVGSGLYLAGALLLTVAHHVPLNDSLATVSPHSPGAAAHWRDYLHRWNPANHLRAAAGLGAAAAFAGALIARD
jgi:uncharacterized membrane protein